MPKPAGAGSLPRYDRDFLLSPAKRNQVLDLWEVEQFGRDSFDDPDYLSIFGIKPSEWHARGVRIHDAVAMGDDVEIVLVGLCAQPVVMKAGWARKAALHDRS